MNDSLKRTNGETDSLKKPTVFNRYAQYVKEDEDMSQESPKQSSDEEERSEERTPSPVPPISKVLPLSKSSSPLISPIEARHSRATTNYNNITFSKAKANFTCRERHTSTLYSVNLTKSRAFKKFIATFCGLGRLMAFWMSSSYSSK